MEIDGAIIKEQGVTFAIVIVKKFVIDNRSEADRMILSLRSVFPGMPVVLMAIDHRGNPSYYGRSDISKFLANTPMEAIPWKRFRVA